jgi:hypothetical protein
LNELAVIYFFVLSVVCVFDVEGVHLVPLACRLLLYLLYAENQEQSWLLKIFQVAEQLKRAELLGQLKLVGLVKPLQSLNCYILQGVADRANSIAWVLTFEYVSLVLHLFDLQQRAVKQENCHFQMTIFFTRFFLERMR